MEEVKIEEVLIEKCSKAIGEIENVKEKLRGKRIIDKIYEEGKMSKRNYDASINAIKKGFGITQTQRIVDTVRERSGESG